MQALETQIQEYIDLSKKHQEEAQRRRQDLQEESGDEEDGGAQRILATQEVEKQLGLLDADQVSSTVVFLQVRSKRTGQDISNIITSDGSKVLVGIGFGVNQRIKDVTTKNRSAAAVGVFDKNVDIRDFFKST